MKVVMEILKKLIYHILNIIYISTASQQEGESLLTTPELYCIKTRSLSTKAPLISPPKPTHPHNHVPLTFPPPRSRQILSLYLLVK